MQATKRMGKQTVRLAGNVKVIGGASVVGTKEGEGPLGSQFDQVMEDGYWGEKTWEKAEAKMQKTAVSKAVAKAGKALTDIHAVFAGDLLNQCIGTSYGLRELEIPYVGLYGACSTMAESMGLGAMYIDGGFGENVVCGTSSHFCSSERQFRQPLEYGGQRPFTAQLTVTGSGMVVLSNEGTGPYITHVTTGKIVDKGIKDALNMGAAMAPAAVDTILTHFEDTNTTPSDYDLILTGDLGQLGHDIVFDLMKKNGVTMNNFNDCGLLIYDNIGQDAHSGGSGCGCSAAVLTAHILPQLAAGKLQKVLFVGTGALMSPTSTLQGESIPAVAHGVVLSNTKE